VLGETGGLIGIYGAVDRAVAQDPERRDGVARLLPVYRDPDVRWFDEFEEWVGRRLGAPPFPSLEAALSRLGEHTAPSPRMRARRLFAIALATRAFPELRDPHGDLAARARVALAVEGIAGTTDRAQELLDLLGDEELLPRDADDLSEALDAWWDNLLSRAVAAGVLDEEAAAALGPRPCSGRLVTVDLPGGPRPVATLTTELETDRITFARATEFLDPATWPECCDFWCEMRLRRVLAGGEHRFHETVSTDCGAWRLETDLDFRFTSLPGVASLPEVAIVEYELSDGLPRPGDAIEVDEGSLVVWRVAPEPDSPVRIKTTKRIRFDHPFSGEALALIMCALGYAAMHEDLVFNCAALGERGTPFPGEQRERGAAEGARVAEALTGELADAAKACVDEWAEAVRTSSAKAAEGRYTADALVQDMASMWVRMLQDGAAGADAVLRSGGRARRTRARAPAER
jgi:hypothetical protein